MNPRLVFLVTCIVALVWVGPLPPKTPPCPDSTTSKTKRIPWPKAMLRDVANTPANQHPVSPPPANYDMGPSIARSDSFDVRHYDLFLDVTDYVASDGRPCHDYGRAHGGNTMWWDLQGLVVDSVAWDGEPVLFNQWDSRLHVQSPSATAGNNVSLEVWYGGQPDDDPYWGGTYYASNIIYNLGIGLTSIPPNFGKVVPLL